MDLCLSGENGNRIGQLEKEGHQKVVTYDKMKLQEEQI